MRWLWLLSALSLVVAAQQQEVRGLWVYSSLQMLILIVCLFLCIYMFASAIACACVIPGSALCLGLRIQCDK